MKYVIIGSSGHHHQITDAMGEGLCGAPCAIAAGDALEDMEGLYQKTGAPVYASWREMVDEIHPDIAVINSWYGHLSEKTEYCLSRGIHVYSEKPLAADLDSLEHLAAVYENSGRELGCMLNLNCCGWYKAVEQAVRGGEIGQVRLIHGQKSYRMGVRGPQYRLREDYGGTIPWIAIHAVDWVLRLGGPCEQVSAFHSDLCNRGNGSMEATSSVLLRLKDGVIGSVDADFLRPTGSARHDDDRLRVTGTRGMIEVIDGLVWLENEEKRRELPLPKGENPFIRFVNSLGTPLCKTLAQEAIEDTRVCLLARQSADTGESVKTGKGLTK